MRTIGLLVVAMALVVGAGGATAATASKPVPCDKFAAVGGSDSHPGTRTRPFRSPRKLVRSLKHGEVGCLRGGVYGDASSYQPLNGNGVASRPIKLRNYPGESVTLKGYVEVNSNFITIRGLHVDGSNNYLNNPSKCGTQALGIMLSGSDVVFEHNDVYQSGLKGSAMLNYGNGNVIRYNKLHDFGSCHAFDHGVYIGGGDSVQIYGNWIWNNPHGWGVQVYPGPTNARIHDNVIDANGGGFVISDEGSPTSTGNQVFRNVVINSVGMTTQGGSFIPGAALSGTGAVPGSNNTFTGNAVFNNPVGTAPNVVLADNVEVDPTFVDAAGHNYAVSPSSPLTSWSLWNGR